METNLTKEDKRLDASSENTKDELHEGDLAIRRITEDELAAYSSKGRSSSFKVEDSGFKEVVSELIPAAVAAVDVYKQKDLALVKFPEGVTWGDLCVRKSDNWKLLSNFKDGKFNEMAAIKQAGLQPAAVANLALQCAAVVVGQAYMAKINEQLEGIESGIAGIRRYLEASEAAKVDSAYHMLFNDYVLRFGENFASPEKRQIALMKIADIREVALHAWYLQIKLLSEKKEGVRALAKPKEKELARYIEEVKGIERAAASAFVLVASASQTAMQYDCNFTSQRIEADRADLDQMLCKWREAHDGFYGILRTRAALVKEVPILGAKQKREMDRAIAKAASSDDVSSQAAVHSRRLSIMNFVYNQANALVVCADEVRLVG